MDRWRGKCAVVTGVSSGIGEAVLRRLASLGLKVLGLARRVDRIQELEDEMVLKGLTVKCIQCDVTKKDEVTSAFEWLEENWGQVDVMVNNAGVFHFSRFIDPDFYDKTAQTMELNVLGLTLCSTLAVQNMMRNGVVGGHIININSVAGHRLVEGEGFIPYGASKHAVTVICDQLRTELSNLENPIRVTDISPGLTKSEISMAYVEMLGSHLSMFMLEAEDIVEAIVYALSAPPFVNISHVMIQPIRAQLSKLTEITQGGKYEF